MGVDSSSSWTVPLLGLFANGMLALGSYGIARHPLRRPQGLDRILAASLVFWSATTLGLELLGAFGAIAPGPVLAWSGAVLAIGGALAWLRRDEPKHRAGTGEGPLTGEALVVLGLVLSAGLARGLPSLLQAVKVVSDGPIYHLYFAARWWKAGRLLLVAAPFGENAATYFPANGDLWFTWLMTAWGGETLAKVGQAPFLLLAGAAAYGCARTLGARRSAGWIATAWFVSSTPLFVFSFEPNVDTIFVAGYLLATYYFLAFARGEGSMTALLLGSLAVGEALGTKAIGVVFLPPLIALVLAGIWRRAEPAGSRLRQTAVVVLAPLITGGYWFARNAWLTGNPLYPLEVRSLGRTLLAGWYGPEAMRHSPYYLPRGDWRALGDILLAVLDPRLAPLWLVAMVVGWAYWRRLPSSARPWIGVFALLAVLNIALYWVVIPYRTQQRFMLQALGLAVVPLAATFELGPGIRRAAAVLLGLHILTPQSWPFPARDPAIPWDLSPVIPNAVGALLPIFPRLEPGALDRSPPGPVVSPAYLGMTLAAVVMVGAWGRAGRGIRPRSRRVLGAAAAGVFLLLGILGVHGGLGAADARFAFYPPFLDFYVGWLNLDARCGPAGSRVAYAGTNLPYYLLGRGLRNEVRYVNVDRHRNWLLHDYHREARARGDGLWPDSRPGWDRIHPDYEAWLENLDAEGIQLLVVARLNTDAGFHNVADPENFPIERRWADSHPARFELLYGRREQDPWFRLYRVRRPAPADRPRGRTAGGPVLGDRIANPDGFRTDPARGSHS